MPVTQVRSKQQFLVTDHVAFGNFRITNLADPIAAQDAATKAYVDAVKTGLDIKDSVKAATTGNITLSAPQTIDGVAVVAGDRVLVKDQTTASGNGIYVVAAGAWTRATDADNTPAGEVTAGMFCFVEEGTANADSGWVLTTNGAIILGTTALTFTQFSGAGQISAGNGLTKTGNTIDVVGTAGRIVANADSIDLATSGVTAGTWIKTTVDAYGRVTSGANATTSDISEGTNLYYTDARAQAAITGGASTIVTANLTADRALISSATGKVAVSAATATELGYLSGVTSAIQTQLNAKQALDADLTAIAALAGTSGLLRKTAADTWSLDTNTYLTANQTITLSGDATGSGTTSISVTLANSGVTAGTYRSVTVNAKGLVTAGTNPTTLAGYGITDAQPLDADLTAIAALAGTSGILRKTAADTWSLDTNTYLTSAVTTISFGTTGLTPVTASSGAVTVAGTLLATNGGTGQSSYAVGDILYASAATTLAKLTAVATGNVLISGGVTTAPSWGKVGLTTHVSGTLPIANGGTNVTTTPTNGQLLIGNGSGYALAAITPGTGITVTNGAGTITISTSALIGSNFVDKETPTRQGGGTAPDGVTTIYNLANTPVTGSEHVYVNGVLQNAASNDYSISGGAITFVGGAIPQTNDVILVSYRK
jgi:phage-related tail fiber protein